MTDKTVFGQKKNKCFGCGACSQACPVNAIDMVEDELGFIYPKVDKDRCIDCGACKRVCIISDKAEIKSVKRAYAASLKNDTEVMKSASGGVFYGLAKKVIHDGGVVYGAVMEKNPSTQKLHVHHKCAAAIQELEQFQGSKYVQSDTTGIFKDVKNRLDSGIKVLFSGTPCQNAALKKFLKKDYENLISVEIICHGVPNEKLFRDFISFYQIKLKGDIRRFFFRDKSKGQGYTTKTVYTSYDGKDKECIKPGQQMAYIFLFSKSLTLRENCYSCPFAGENRAADITIGDFWGFNNFYPYEEGFDTSKGISCILINSDKGDAFFNECSDSFYVKESSFDEVRRYNEQLKHPAEMPDNRNEVMQVYRKYGYIGLEKFYSRKYPAERLKYKVAGYMPQNIKRSIRKFISK